MYSFRKTAFNSDIAKSSTGAFRVYVVGFQEGVDRFLDDRTNLRVKL